LIVTADQESIEVIDIVTSEDLLRIEASRWFRELAEDH
jgi:hypothetical protein